MDAPHQDQDSKSPQKKRRYTFGAIAIGVTVAILEIFVLVGDPIVEHRFDGASIQEFTVSLDRLDERHLIVIRTSPKASITCQITDPEGNVLVDIDEMKRHRRHYAEITPTLAGDYRVRIETSRASLQGRLEVLINDRRIFGPWGYWLGL
ncbi:MAG: hypothetical protein ACO3UM_02640 [Planctomycetota bacterium]